MNTDALVHELRKRDIVVSVEQGALRVKAPEGTLTDDLRQAIRERKDALVTILTDKKFGWVKVECPACGTDRDLTHDNRWACPNSKCPDVAPRYIKRCSSCGWADWKPTGRYTMDGCEIWDCKMCHDFNVETLA